MMTTRVIAIFRNWMPKIVSCITIFLREDTIYTQITSTTFLGILFFSGGTSNQKLELLVAGASDLSARVQKLIARKLRAHDILIATHAPDACVA